jgi:hypothetical protein
MVFAAKGFNTHHSKNDKGLDLVVATCTQMLSRLFHRGIFHARGGHPLSVAQFL